MNIKHLLTISLAVLLTACNQPPPTQSNVYQEPVPIRQDNDGIDASDVALGVATGAVVGAVGVATGYAVGKYANKPRYSETRTVYGKPKASYGKPVVVVNKHYYQTKQKVRASRYKRK